MKITVKDIGNFIQGNITFSKRNKLPTFLLEQINYRSFRCWDCLLKGKCKNCGCTTPHMFFAPNKLDINWGPIIINKEDWDDKKSKDEDFKRFLEFCSYNDFDPADNDFSFKLRSWLYEKGFTGKEKDNPILSGAIADERGEISENLKRA